MKHIYLLFFVLLIGINANSQNSFFYSNTVHHYETAVNGLQQWRYFVGNSEPDSNWRRLIFNDASWALGNGGIGYSDGDDATNVGVCNSVYMRKLFTIIDTSKITEFLLSIDYDDGFVAYINNVEVARKNIGTVGVIPSYNMAATAPHEANLIRSLNAEYFVIKKNIINSLVKNGSNVLCVQVHNNATSGSDNDLTAIPYLMVGLNNSSVAYGQNPTWFKPPFCSHLPIVQLLLNNVVIVNEPKKTVKMRIVYNGYDQNHLTDSANDYSGKIGIELRGASSLNFPQKSYSLTTYDSIDQPDNVKILDFPKESDYILYAPYNDKSLIRNYMMFDLARKMGWWSSRCKLVEVFLDTAYMGVYVFMEKIKIDKERVAITQIKPNHNAGDSLTGGYIFKVDWNADAGLGTWNSHVTNYNGQAKTVRFQCSDPNGLDITQPQRDFIEGFLDSFEQNLISANYTNLNTGYRKYIDVGSFIDFFLLNEITHNVDAYRASTYFFKNKNSQGGKIVMGPLWDFNYSLGNASFCGSNDTNGWAGCTANNTLWWFDRLSTENYYRDQLRCRWTSLYYSVLSPYNINNYLDSIGAYLQVPATRHFVRWPILGTDLNNGHTSSNYYQEITWMKNWYRGRTNWLNLFMPGWHNPCWESPYANRITLTEFNYNSDKNMDAGNWIELYNGSSGSVNLNNFVLTANGGATSKKFSNISIPAFSYIVICEDTNQFKKIYPDVKNRVGNIGFGFNNSYGRLILYDPTTYPVFSAIYSAESPWPQGPNGGGKTLEHLGNNNNYNNHTNWFEGCIGGSPGRAYGKCLQDVNVTEINYTSATNHNTGDWIELKNNSNLPKNIGGYVFKDDDDTHIFTFPTNFTIPANSYYIVCADTAKFKSFHPNIKNRIGNFNFGLSNKSDAIRIFTNTNVLYQSIYYTDTAAPWPSGANGTGYTIELENDTFQCDNGSNWSIGCLYGSPGARYHKVCNPALTAKTNISEIAVKPSVFSDDGGWVEIHNYNNSDLDLTDFTLAHNNSADTAYLIKEGTILKKNDFLVFCNDTSKFRKWHPQISNIYALNKWKLNNNSDSIIIKDFNNNKLIVMKYALNTFQSTEANGLGKTLELFKDTSNLNLNTSWFDGCFGGSPGEGYQKCKSSKAVISELNYSSSPNFNQGFWFEIKNLDTISINLNNYTFRRAFDTTTFRFKSNISLAPKQYYTVSFDSINFTQSNPFVQRVMFLSNPGFGIKSDIIQLFANDTQLLNFQYKDTLPYPLGANGNGFTLVLQNDSVNPYYAASLATQCYGGSPGGEAIYPCNPALSSDIHISEINYRSEPNSNSGFWFEVENKSSNSIDLHNWVITNSNLTNNFKLNQITSISPNGFRVFASDSIKFKQQYPTVTNVSFIPGNLFAQLKDSIKIFDYRGFLACNAFYSNDSTWPQPSNGLGYTLENVGGSKKAIATSNWNYGCLLGSPGISFTPCIKSPILISEINYKSNISTNSGQWFELKNAGNIALNLNNYLLRFNSNDTLRITSILNPNEYLVIANDSVLFKKQHPYISNCVFKTFKLDTLKSSMRIYNNNVLINSIYYNAANTMLQNANGGGYTLELIHDSLNEVLPSSWTTGCLKGSPGTSLLSPCNPALTSNIIFSETNYASDTFNNSGWWVELYNKSAQTLNLHHWILKNGNNGAFVFKIPTNIGANSYIVLSNDTAAFHKVYPTVQNVLPVNLNFSKSGDSIMLIDYAENMACKAFYTNASNWPQGANGNGRTLENSSSTKNNISINDWKAGCILGSPGKAFENCIDKIIVTELNYAPQTSTNDGKWLELFIQPTFTSNISKYILRQSSSVVSFNTTKPSKSNDYLVLCSDTTAFNSYHKFIENKEQFQSLNIANGIHNLVIYDQNYTILQSFQYSSLAPWDSMANGKGYTLELLKDSTNFSAPNNWKSYCKRGSAGGPTITPCGNAFGINNNQGNSAPVIYPNPAGKSLTIDKGFATSKITTYRVLNLLGQVVLEGVLTERITTIEISAFAAGIYMIQLDQMAPLKFIKE